MTDDTYSSITQVALACHCGALMSCEVGDGQAAAFMRDAWMTVHSGRDCKDIPREPGDAAWVAFVEDSDTFYEHGFLNDLRDEHGLPRLPDPDLIWTPGGDAA